MSKEAMKTNGANTGYSDTGERKDVPPGYKRTEVGVIPEEWDVKLLPKISWFQEGPGLRNWQFTKIGIKVINVTNLEDGFLNLERTDRHISVSEFNKMYKHFEVDAGDIVMASSGNSYSKIALVRPQDLPLVMNTSVIRFKALEAVDYGFLWILLASPLFKNQIDLMITGGAQPNFGPYQLKRINFPIPSLSEQCAIAKTLSDVDGLLGALDELIAKKRAIKQATMQQLLTGKTRLPGFSGKWETKRLGDHMRFLKTGSNSRSELNTDGPVAYLHYGDIHTNDAVRLNANKTPVPRIASERVRLLDRLRVGDLIFVDASEDLSGVGKSIEIESIPEGGMVAGLHTIGARFDKTILADGFKAYLQFCPEVLNTLKRLAAGTKVLATNRQHIANIEMALPCVKEQAAIATVLSDMDAEIEALERRRGKAGQIKQGMMQQLLTGQVRLVKARV